MIATYTFFYVKALNALKIMKHHDIWLMVYKRVASNVHCILPVFLLSIMMVLLLKRENLAFLSCGCKYNTISVFFFFFLHPIVYLFIYLFIFILLLCYFKNIIGNSLINILHCMSEWMCLR